jgi:malate permease and related proteins
MRYDALSFEDLKTRSEERQGRCMNNYLVLGTCFLIGIVLRQSGRLPANAAAALNGFVIHVSLPALTLTYVHNLKLGASLILPALMAWVMFGIGCAFFWGVSRLLGLSRASTGALMLTGGLGNTSFVGLPMIETFYGQQFLGLGILIDQLGSYFVLSTLGVAVASLYSSGKDVKAKTVIWKIARFMPFQAFVLALLLMPFEYPVWASELLKRLGATLVPIALVSVGYQLHLSHVRGKASALAAGLAFKLAIGPAIILFLFAGMPGAGGDTLRVTVFEAAMGPMIGASIVAMDHELDPPLVTLMVGVGIPLSFLTLPVWWHLLSLL